MEAGSFPKFYGKVKDHFDKEDTFYKQTLSNPGRS